MAGGLVGGSAGGLAGDGRGVPVRPSAAHREWSHRIKELGSTQLRRHVREIRESAAELGVWDRGGYVPLQPFILTAASRRLLHQAGRRLQDLLVAHALDGAGGDLRRLADIAEWPPEDRWFLDSTRPLPDALGSRRGDVYIAGGRPQFLENNFGTCLNGGITSSVLSSVFLGTSLGAELGGALHMEYGSFLGNLVRWVRQRLPGRSARVALLGIAGEGDEGSLRWAEHHAAYFAHVGISCDFVPLGEADVVDGWLTWRGVRYEGAVRYFMIGQRVSDHADFIGALERASETVLFGGYVSQVFTSKGLLADLYQDERLTAAQRELLGYVPWTARLAHGRVRKGEGRVDPVEWAAGNRESAVLKPCNSHGGRGLVVGRSASEADWRRAVDAAARAGGHVVQEAVRPDSWECVYWHIESESLVCAEAPVLVGPYVVDGADGGAYTRQPVIGTESDLLAPDSAVSLGCVASAS